MNLEIATSQNFILDYFFFKSPEIITLDNKQWLVGEREDKTPWVLYQLSDQKLCIFFPLRPYEIKNQFVLMNYWKFYIEQIIWN